MSIFIDTVPKKQQQQQQRFRVSPKAISQDSSNGLESLVFVTVSMNILIHRPMGFGILVFFLGLSRRICSLKGVWVLIFWSFWDCLEEYAHVVSFDCFEKYVDFPVCKHVYPFMSQLRQDSSSFIALSHHCSNGQRSPSQRHLFGPVNPANLDGAVTLRRSNWATDGMKLLQLERPIVVNKP